MYINPDTNVILLSHVPLDATYGHTITFSSREEQANYFKSKIHIATAPADTMRYEFSKQTYIRVYNAADGIFKAEIEPHVADQIFKVNYIMFQNDIYQHRWFYAFVTDVQYISNRCWQFSFELDILQSFMFDYNVKECWVEREHVNDDTIGKHTLPEPIDIGEYVINDYETDESDFLDYSVMIGYVQGEGSGSISASYISGQFSGVFYEIRSCNSQSEAVGIGSFLAGFTEDGKNDNVVSITFVPSAFVSSSGSPVTKQQLAPTNTRRLDGYSPRNNKLLTFPYVALYVHNGDNDEMVLEYEQFDTDNPKFLIIGATSPTPEIICYPYNYAGKNQSVDNKIGISNFPQCAYAMDTYRAWLAMNGSQQTLNMARNIGTSLATGNIATLGLGAWQALVDNSKAAIMSDKAKGTQTGNAMVSARKLCFYFERKTIKAEYARIIDDYFDRFGYQVNRCKKPNVTGRPNWNYVKTRGCTISGSLPMDVAVEICNIFDRGITFWHNPNNVGDYSVDNSA